jgi:hypothetical protein
LPPPASQRGGGGCRLRTTTRPGIVPRLPIHLPWGARRPPPTSTIDEPGAAQGFWPTLARSAAAPASPTIGVAPEIRTWEVSRAVTDPPWPSRFQVGSVPQFKFKFASRPGRAPRHHSRAQPISGVKPPPWPGPFDPVATGQPALRNIRPPTLARPAAVSRRTVLAALRNRAVHEHPRLLALGIEEAFKALKIWRSTGRVSFGRQSSHGKISSSPFLQPVVPAVTNGQGEVPAW